MIAFGKPYTKKKIKELPFGKLLSVLVSASIVDWEQNGHKGAVKERTFIVQELFSRMDITIPTPEMIDEMFPE